MRKKEGHRNVIPNERTDRNQKQLLAYCLMEQLYGKDSAVSDVGMDCSRSGEGNASLNFDAVVMAANIQTFSELLHSLKEDELFWHINDRLNRLIPPVKEFGGVIYQYLGSGFQAFFQEDEEAALRAGLKVCASLWDYGRGAVSLSSGKIMLGLIGGEESLMPVVISETTGLTDYLMGIAPKYSSKIMVTGSFTDRIEGFRERFLNRFIGYIYIRSSQSFEKIYDVFQGDAKEVLWMKNRTRLMFEEGVRLYSAFQYKMARRHFIEVLKVFREDCASKCYLNLCDYYLQRDVGEERQVSVETY